jgi:hypothetical protein
MAEKALCGLNMLEKLAIFHRLTFIYFRYLGREQAGGVSFIKRGLFVRQK